MAVLLTAVRMAAQMAVRIVDPARVIAVRSLITVAEVTAAQLQATVVVHMGGRRRPTVEVLTGVQVAAHTAVRRRLTAAVVHTAVRRHPTAEALLVARRRLTEEADTRCLPTAAVDVQCRPTAEAVVAGAASVGEGATRLPLAEAAVGITAGAEEVTAEDAADHFEIEYGYAVQPGRHFY